MEKGFQLKSRSDLTKDSSIRVGSCATTLGSVRKSELTNYLGTLAKSRLPELDYALKMALELG